MNKTEGTARFSSYQYAADDSDDEEYDESLSPRDVPRGASGDEYDPLADSIMKKVAEREKNYQRRVKQLPLPTSDPFASAASDADERTYARIMTEKKLEREKKALTEDLKKKIKEGTLKPVISQPQKPPQQQQQQQQQQQPPAKKRRWDQAATEGVVDTKPKEEFKKPKISLIQEAATPFLSKWNETPARCTGEETPFAATPGARQSRWGATPLKSSAETPGRVGQEWSDTPKLNKVDFVSAGATPTAAALRRSRWDETPAMLGLGRTPLVVGTPSLAFGAATPLATLPSDTPMGVTAMGMATPFGCTPVHKRVAALQREIDDRNRPFLDAELDAVLPEGYKIIPPPAGYVPATPSRKITATPTPACSSSSSAHGQPPDFYAPPPEEQPRAVSLQPADDSLPAVRPDELDVFGSLLDDVGDESELSKEELDRRAILKLILKVKNGTPPMRKSAMRQMTQRAGEFGADAVLGVILPFFARRDTDDVERHLMTKLLTRIMYRLDHLVAPHAERILLVFAPELIGGSGHYAVVEAREVVSNLAKAVGLLHIIPVMRPYLDHHEETLRTSMAYAFAVISAALGIPAVLPFLKAVCSSKKSWEARHTGARIVQQMAIVVRCAVLPHLRDLVETTARGLGDDSEKVRTMTAHAIAALAEASTPYGIEEFACILRPLRDCLNRARAAVQGPYLKAFGNLVPLMDEETAFHCTSQIMPVIVKAFQGNDTGSKQIVLKVLMQCCATDGINGSYIKEVVLPPFFACFWNNRTAHGLNTSRQLVDTTVSFSGKVGASEIIGRIVNGLQEESSDYRKMVMTTVERVVQSVGLSDLDPRQEEILVDRMCGAFTGHDSDEGSIVNGVATVFVSLGERSRPYVSKICGIVQWKMNFNVPRVRELAADLMSRLAPVIMACGCENTLLHLAQLFYEHLGEEFPDVLGSILGALKGIVNVVGMSKMTPPVKDLLPRLTPILKNRNEKVQENCIDLIGRIADRGAEYVAPREWMRICFELLELLKAHKKAIRRAAVNTFGYIAKAIGPNDVLSTLLNNLKVQERQNRVCTTVAIAIVAEICAPFTVVPALMNEYRTPELNVQNGVLKSFSFMFEYVGEMGKDYVYAVVPLLEDALTERDPVHRQTAMSAIGHLALGVRGLGCEGAMHHLLNYVWPNILETSAHVHQAFLCAVEGLTVCLGPAVIMQYLAQGLYHPARAVRQAYWRVYNSVYVMCQDAMVAAHPVVRHDDEEDERRYGMDELGMIF